MMSTGNKSTISTGLKGLLCTVVNLAAQLVRSVVSYRSGWRELPVNATQLLEGTHTEISMPSYTLCALAAANTDTELFCFQGSRCIIAIGDVWLLNFVTVSERRCSWSGKKSCLLPNKSELSLKAPGVGCIYVRLEAVTYSDAKTCCRTMTSGADLVTTASTGETEDFTALLYTHFPISAYPRFWVGLERVSGTFYWNTGSGRPIDPTEWRPNWPYYFDCAYIRFDIQIPSVCQFEEDKW